MDELDHQKIIKKIIYKELEPSVLNEQIITKAILDQGRDGEAGRLFRSAEIQYDKITVLRLEFLNILKIDHVWILPNLQILSLAFNKLDKIENLEALTALKELNMTYNSITKLENLSSLKSLEIFSVFGNKIQMIENVDRLDNLIIFSAGNNLIKTKEGIERLRFLKKLRCLNLKGNEVEQNDKFFRIYIAGLLPQLTYYENKYISKVQRDEGKDRFRFKLREIMDNEKFEVLERERIARELEENVHLKKCFVEHLEKDQLFDSLFVFDSEEQGDCLLNIGGEEKNLIADFHDQSHDITQKIFKIGLEQYEKRTAEQKIFKNCMTVGKQKIQVQGQKTIELYFEKREEVFYGIKKLGSENPEAITDELIVEKVVEATEKFNELHEETWKSLMENEMHLHESVNDSNTIFSNVIMDMVNEFMEQCKSQFVQLREVEGNFVDALTEAVQNYVTTLASSGREQEIPEVLRASLIERDIIYDMASGMREMHMLKIDGREDLLVSRGKNWVQELCDQMTLNEIERNRRKVMEINFFLDNQQIEFENLMTEIRMNLVKEQKYADIFDAGDASEEKLMEEACEALAADDGEENHSQNDDH